MRAVVQRVTRASVTVADRIVGEIGAGLLVYVGVGRDDTDSDATALAAKIAGLRVFLDANEVMNQSVVEQGSSVLAVSAFTTLGDARRGRRPTYEAAAPHEQAEPLYEKFCQFLADHGVRVERGRFRADMQVASVNDGPVCVLLDTKKAF